MTVAGGGLNWVELAFGNSNTGAYCGVWAAIAGAPPADDPPVTCTETGSTAQGSTPGSRS